MEQININLEVSKVEFKSMLKEYLNYIFKDRYKRARGFGITAGVFLILGIIFPFDTTKMKEIYFGLSFFFGFLAILLYYSLKKSTKEIIEKTNSDNDSDYSSINITITENSIQLIEPHQTIETNWSNFEYLLIFEEFYVLKPKNVLAYFIFLPSSFKLHKNYQTALDFINSKIEFKKIQKGKEISKS